MKLTKEDIVTLIVVEAAMMGFGLYAIMGYWGDWLAYLFIACLVVSGVVIWWAARPVEKKEEK